METFTECSSRDWDNYDAEPISSQVVHETFKFINLLPLDISMPDVVPEPAGGIGLLWQKSDSYVLSLTVTAEGVVSYAYIFGKNEEGCGHFQFFDELPEMIGKLLQGAFID